MKHCHATLLAALMLFATACFSMEHRLPAGTYFGALPEQPGQVVQPFTVSGHKSYFLAGLFPYTTWGSSDLVRWKPPQARLEQLRIQTEFDWFDTLVWIVPGQVYGYYFWAPRTVRISGNQVSVPR